MERHVRSLTLLFAIVFALSVLCNKLQAARVCYDVYGCFSNTRHFNRQYVPLPESPESIHTQFMLYTRDSPLRYQQLYEDTHISNTFFNASRETVIIIHGFAGFTTKTSITHEEEWWGFPMKNELLWEGDFNVIVVDWMRGAWFPFTRAVANTRLVGAQVTRLLEILAQQSNRELAYIHVIGFSFGAHVAGYVGRRMRKKGRPIDRITGLDPAAMWFNGLHADVRLDPSDALFVDVIHTSAAYGITNPVGHVDFFPNGGKKQPGCNSLLGGFTNYLFCSHNRAPLLFTTSLYSRIPFYGYPCRTEDDFNNGKCLKCKHGECLAMGFRLNTRNNTLKGSFHLRTSARAPYNVYHYEISLKTMKSWYAGIYGPVFVVIEGTRGKSDVTKAMKYLPGCTEKTYLLTSPRDLGTLTKLTVWHHGVFQSWGLDRVVVRPAWTNQRYVSKVNAWLRYGNKAHRKLHPWKVYQERKAKIRRRLHRVMKH